MGRGSWVVQNKLGEGGSGAVYLAVTPEGPSVAVKVLSGKAAVDQASLLEHEAGLLIRLRHPSIASILGYLKNSSPIFGDNLGPCFWMDYVDGEDILTAVSRLDPKMRTDTILNWLEQALDALGYLHGQEVLHGDLSPGNIRINAEGRLKLIDFGMATTLRAARPGRAATLIYLAPERIGGKNGPACDLFSLGTIFYEIMAGSHPRAGCRSLSDMVRKAAKPLLEACPGLGASAAVPARVIDRLILANPLERFHSAQEALEALRGGAAREFSTSAAPLYPMAMIGTADAVGRLTQALEDIEGRSRILAVHGPTGVGKSRLLREFAFACALDGRNLHEASAHSRSFQDPGVYFLRSLERWNEGDISSLFQLRRAALPPHGTLIVLEWNDDRLPEALARVLSSLLAHPDVEEIRLGNLSAADTEKLTRTLLERDPGRDLLSFVYEQSSGNPLMIIEVVTLIRDRGAWNKEGLEALRGFRTVDDVLTQRLSDIAGDARRLLLLLSVAHYPVGLDELLRSISDAGEPEKDVFAALVLLDDLTAKGFVARDEDTGAYRLAMPELERFLLGRATAEEQRRAHETWWGVVAAAPNPNPQKAHHAAARGLLKETAEIALPAVEDLVSRGRKIEAIRLIDEAVSCLEDTTEIVALSRLYRAKINLLGDLGRFAEALDLLDRALALAAPDEPMNLKQAKYWLVSGLMHQNLGEFPEAVRRFRECLTLCESSGDESLRPYHVRALSLLGLRALDEDDVATAKSWFEKAITEDRENGRRRAEILRNLATALANEKDWMGVDRTLQESMEIYTREKHEPGRFATRLLEGNLAVLRGDPVAADRAYTEAESIAASKEDDLLLAIVWNNQGTLARKRGDLALSREKLQRGLEVFRALGSWDHLSEGLKQNAVTEAACGHFALANNYIEELRKLALRLPGAAKRADDALEAFREYRDGIPSEPPPTDLPLKENDWNQEGLLRRLTREARDTEQIRALLNRIYEKLPNPLKVSFVDRADYKRWILGQPPQGGST